MRQFKWHHAAVNTRLKINVNINIVKKNVVNSLDSFKYTVLIIFILYFLDVKKGYTCFLYYFWHLNVFIDIYNLSRICELSLYLHNYN